MVDPGSSSPCFDLARRLEQRRSRNLYRTRRVLRGPQRPHQQVDGQAVLSFCSNDYLGLAAHPAVIEAMQRGAAAYGAGSGAAHLVNGHSAAHHALEEELADFLGRPRALLFSTGYMANLGVVSALVGKGDTVFQDRLNHASLLDAGLLSGARFRRFAHADPGDLQRKMEPVSGSAALVLTDGLFSMDGDLAPLPQLAAVTRNRGGWLMVDDAHGIGVMGATGRGSLEHHGLDASRVPVLVGTLGKAFGTFGAFVAGSEDLVEQVIQAARTYIYTTALPPAVAEATRAGLRIVREEPERREQLRKRVQQFRAGAQELGFRLPPCATPIQPLVVGGSSLALDLSRRLLERGILVSAIRPPTVPDGTARLRVTLSAAHTSSDVDGLLEALNETDAMSRIRKMEPAPT